MMAVKELVLDQTQVRAPVIASPVVVASVKQDSFKMEPEIVSTQLLVVSAINVL